MGASLEWSTLTSHRPGTREAHAVRTIVKWGGL
jgi:hypothetical protein